ncbi:hypothetical protein CYMTET_12038, partial [Cymbomonas tetramitiformis]
VRMWDRQLGVLRARRAERARWRHHRLEMHATQQLEEELVKCHCFTTRELERVAQELQAEQNSFMQEWKAWEKKAKNQVLSRPLPKHWLPQVEPVTNKVYYLNTKAGTLHRNHPYMIKVIEYAKEELPKWKKALEGRLNMIQTHGERIKQRCRDIQQAIYDRLQEARQVVKSRAGRAAGIKSLR